MEDANDAGLLAVGDHVEDLLDLLGGLMGTWMGCDVRMASSRMAVLWSSLMNCVHMPHDGNSASRACAVVVVRCSLLLLLLLLCSNDGINGKVSGRVRRARARYPATKFI